MVRNFCRKREAWVYTGVNMLVPSTLAARDFSTDDVENLSQIWAVAPALAKLALRDDRRSHLNKEPPWKRITEGLPSAT